MHLLNLAAGESPFDGQEQAGEGEGGPNRRFRLRTNVLGSVSIDKMLMDKRRVAVGQRVIGQLVHQAAAFAGRIGPMVGFQAEAWQLQAASRADRKVQQHPAVTFPER